MPEMKRFGEKLRTLRKRRGLTTRQLGPMLDVYFTYISQLENGNRKPNVEMVLKVADLFGVSLDRLMRDELEVDVGEDEAE